MKKIKRNRVMCVNCYDVIESKYRHDFLMCKCGKIGVDGGLDYLRRLGEPEDMEEMAEYTEGNKPS